MNLASASSSASLNESRHATEDCQRPPLKAADLHRCTDARKTPPGLPLSATLRCARAIIRGGLFDLQVEEITRDRSLSVCLPAIQKPCGSTHPNTATKNRGCCSLVLETGRRTGNRAEGGGRRTGVKAEGIMGETNEIVNHGRHGEHGNQQSMLNRSKRRERSWRAERWETTLRLDADIPAFLLGDAPQAIDLAVL